MADRRENASCSSSSLSNNGDIGTCHLKLDKHPPSSRENTTFKPRSQEGSIDKIVFLEVSDIRAIIYTHTSTRRPDMWAMNFWSKRYHVLMNLPNTYQ
jgi:hypothetical protein